MELDVRTMVFMTVVVSLILSGVQALVGAQLRYAQGVRHWAAANLLFGLGLSTVFSPLIDSPWFFVISTPIIALAAGLQFNGIQAFEGRTTDWRMPIGIALLILAINVCFAVLTYNVALRVIANSLVVGLVFAASARALFIRAELPLRAAYWLTGSAFAVLAFLTWIRIVAVLLTTPSLNYLLSQDPLNQAIFVLFSGLLLTITFGFVLMQSYRLSDDLQRLAARDGLTGVLNRRSLEDSAKQVLAHLSRTGGHLAVAMIDIDHFKRVNDQHGHPAGDEVLKAFSRLAQSTIRLGDYFARYGGEEFCLLLPGTLESEATVLADRLRRAFSALQVEIGSAQTLQCTVSIGVTDSVSSGLSFDSLIADADRALYQAKTAGRNCVVTTSPSGTLFPST